MGGKQSTTGRPRGAFPAVSTDDNVVSPTARFGHHRPGGSMGQRSRSASSVAGIGADHGGTVPFGGAADVDGGPGTHSNGYRGSGGGRRTGSMLCLGARGTLSAPLPLHRAPRWLSAHNGFKCPICSKSVASTEMEVHFIMCLSKPRLSYNDDVLVKDSGECVICLEELQQGDSIARLPCLCIYHKSCIDSWFEISRSCPEHPAD
ncbi:E3 ubiquitin-protein ligase znrf1-like [Brienomyrus brachyistius]|uniref:E3 ubiquitin-protein ligase znrf1-like n=1 Tax=Brienomyrus brachyistius TaxID=42636 RepID=UPI0020B3D003|nr:E3 ubiquitin-protein ligase znrf1-like [Brienomyrus brachyistius]XP_048887217.1 E3 ubiquitin-protein ligase znrf1-like [Brienomyrus brachyistius]